MYFSRQTLENMSDMELSVGLEAIQREMKKRQEAKKQLLIEKFHELWKEMKQAEIPIYYGEPDEDPIQLYVWDDFYFG